MLPAARFRPAPPRTRPSADQWWHSVAFSEAGMLAPPYADRGRIESVVVLDAHSPEFDDPTHSTLR